MCEMHGRHGLFFCRGCGEMTCDLEGCVCACHACACPCHGPERVCHEEE